MRLLYVDFVLSENCSKITDFGEWTAVTRVTELEEEVEREVVGWIIGLLEDNFV